MESQYLKTLLVVAEAGSFSRAASILCVTQSAVSQRIKLLEERYAMQLLDRSGPVLVTTEAGRVVLKMAEQIMRLERELENELKQLNKTTRLALCSTPTFGIAYLPKVMNKFILRTAETVDLKFMLHSPEQALKGLQDNEFDIGVLEHCDQLDFDGFTTIDLPVDELVFISSPSFALPAGELTIELLMQQRLIARKEGCSSRKLLAMNLARFSRNLTDFKGVIIYDDLRLTIQAVLEGSGIAFVSRSLVKEYISKGELLEHHVTGFDHVRHRTAAINTKRPLSPIVLSFMECLFSTFNIANPFSSPHLQPD
jgi:DNA-binding transcriptional LysR family regulator